MASYTITKDMARNAAKSLVSKKFEKEEKELTEKEYKYGEFLARKYYPSAVLEFISKYYNYVGFYSSFYVKYKISTIRIDTSMKLPTNENVVWVDIEEYNEVSKFRDRWKKLKERKAGTIDYLTDEILKLRTYKRVKEQAPELLPFLPEAKEEKKRPAANYEDFRAFVKSIVEKNEYEES